MTERRWMLASGEIDRIVITGAGTGDVNTTYTREGELNSRPYYAGGDPTDYITWETSPARWEIWNAGVLQYTSTDDVMSPLQVTTWVLSAGSNPLPVLAEDTTNIFTIEVHPANTADVKFSQERDLDNGQIFFRTKLATDLVFGGRGNSADFDMLWEERRRDGCAKLYIRMERRKAGQWRVEWTGRFAPGACRFDLDRCIATVRPEVIDRYTCLLESLNRKENVLRVGSVDAQAAIVFPLEFGACYFEDFTGESACATLFLYGGSTWTAVDDMGYGIGLYRIYARRREVTICMDGTPVPPPGGGWTLETNNCAVDGTAIYTKALTGGEIFTLNITGVVGTCVDGVATPPAAACGAYVLVVDCADADPPVYVCLGATPFPLSGARTLLSVTEFLLRQSNCAVTPEVVSDFLEWNPAGDATGYAAGINYVTGLANQHNHLVVIQNSDAIDPGASEPATRGEMTLGQVLELLNKSAQLFWDITDANELRIEHWTYRAEPIGLDLAAVVRGSEPLAFAPTRDRAPRFEAAKWQTAQAQDFVGLDIEYTGPCVAEGASTRNVDLPYFITDITYINDEPDDIPKDGFTVLACSEDSGMYSVLIDIGAISDTYVSNAPMSWANLQRDFWQHNRFLFAGRMNGEDVTFLGVRPTVEQGNVVVACRDFLTWDPRDAVEGALSARLGLVSGEVTKVEWNPQQEVLTLTVGYAFP
jgi:hypothetical protein